MLPDDQRPIVLHYVGYRHDGGGILAVIRALAGAEAFTCLLGVSPGFGQTGTPALPLLELPAIEGERIGLGSLWRARAVARAIRLWLRSDPRRIYHGHSRAGLLVGLWLAALGETRVAVSVHCYGRQRWFYRWAARRLAGRIYWLSPSMKAYYGIGERTWDQCIPGCLPRGAAGPVRSPRSDRLVVAGIGSIVPWKGWDLVLSALAGMPEPTRRKIIFRHIGSSDATPASEAFAARLRRRSGESDLAFCVEWVGQQPSSAALLAQADLLVVASHNEPFSIAVLEAVAAGVPVLAADSGGAADVIVEGSEGWFFKSGDAGALRRRFTEIATGEASARLVPNPPAVFRYSAPLIAAEWLKVYRTLGSGAGRTV